MFRAAKQRNCLRAGQAAFLAFQLSLLVNSAVATGETPLHLLRVWCSALKQIVGSSPSKSLLAVLAMQRYNTYRLRLYPKQFAASVGDLPNLWMMFNTALEHQMTATVKGNALGIQELAVAVVRVRPNFGF